MNPIGKLLPKDGFQVRVAEQPSLDYTKSLTHLYQPLIGMGAISLYQTLLNEALMSNKHAQTHHSLMTYLQLPLPKIYNLRIKLEAIGLLKTFKRTNAEETIYTYDVQRPFSPKEFFEETMLSELLLHHIGKRKFTELKNLFTKEKQLIGTDVTASFHDVFETVLPDLDYHDITPKEKTTRSLVESIDFSWLEFMLKQRMLPIHKILTGHNKQIISELTHLYDLTSHEIEKALLWAITEDHELNIEEFKQACHDLYATKSNHAKVRLVEKEISRAKKEDTSALSREERLIHRFETMSPRQLLEDLSNGSKASERDLKIIRDVMVAQNLPRPVMNVLVHYALMQSNMKLSKPYLETIASHWSRANLSSAKEAMEFAKNEINNFKERKKRHRNKQSKEVIPDWFKQRHEQEKTEETGQSDVDQEEIMEMLQRHANKK
ncbi:MAG TPA: DnaD domain protein [Bacillota bacterium]|nr:DnaD domain protein [Bacillota bacterium]